MDAKINRISEKLFLITLFPPISGFDDFIGVWLYKGTKTFIVDVGPSVTVKTLINALDKLNVKKLDYILLTHIHLDHAGGIGEIASLFPKTPIVCHEKGVSHLVDPGRLLEGTIKTLGATGKAYGPIKSVFKAQLVDADKFLSDSVNAVITLGHSPHHVSYATDKYLFAGEAGGVVIALPSGRIYMRPATPHRFILDVSIKSINALIDIDPLTICYGHFGIQNEAVKMLKMHKNQILLWEEIINSEINNNKKNFLSICLEKLFEKDPMLSGFHLLDKSQQKRELVFIENSITGFTKYLQAVANNL